MHTTNSSTPRRAPHVVVIGGGFGGLAAARALRHAPVTVTVVDRANHIRPIRVIRPIRHLSFRAAASGGGAISVR